MTTQHAVKAPKKLIEVALPLDDINAAAAREKSIRHGHPSTLHLWWARRPLAAARAVIFAQMVNDPSWRWELEHPGENPPNNLKASWAKARKRLFGILKELVLWKSTFDEDVLDRARAEIAKSWRDTCEVNKDHPDAARLFDPETLPPFHDPFAGGGALPLEAQRLGLRAFASDLNPVAVAINKAQLEAPAKFADCAPANPESRGKRQLLGDGWHGTQGLAEDVQHYGTWMRAEAERRIGGLFPPIVITDAVVCERPDLKAHVGQSVTVIAWLWARTVKSPNPAFKHVDVPLASTFVLSSRETRTAYVEPVVEQNGYRFTVRLGEPPSGAEDGTKTARGHFRCVMSGAPISGEYIQAEARAGRLGIKLMAIVGEGRRGRVYLSPTTEHEEAAAKAIPGWKPDVEFMQQALGFRIGNYGLTKWSDLFTDRQLLALDTFTSLVPEAREHCFRDASASGLWPLDERRLSQAGRGAEAYADAVALYLAFAVDKIADRNSTGCAWASLREHARNTFGRQALPMVWDFAESNPFSDSSGNFAGGIESIVLAISALVPTPEGKAVQADAQSQQVVAAKVISTDPPYYDNIGYADLSDFFYVWMRRSLRSLFPELFATIAVPKTEELVATPGRHGGKRRAEQFFMSGMTEAMRRLCEQTHPAVPLTVYYAFKQAETDGGEGTSSTGWETFLEAVLQAGLTTTGTWPMRTELARRIRGRESNALASSIVLVCKPRSGSARSASRREFVRELNRVLPEALLEMTVGAGDERSPVAPVDLSQSIIGPGMAVFSKYDSVLEADGSRMSVRTALQLINRFLAEDDFDHDSQFCLHWFEQHGWKDGRFGEADTLARAKGTSVEGVRQAGVIYAAAGVVRLLKWSEYPEGWDPSGDTRLPVWEALHHLIRVFKQQGESGASSVLAAVIEKAEPVRQLAYRLYTLCERNGWAEDARAYNEIVTSWSAIETQASAQALPAQTTLFE